MTMGHDSHLIGIPWVESPFFEFHLEERKLTAEREFLARKIHDDGFLVLDDLLTPEDCDRIIAEARPLFDPAVPEGPRSCYRVQDGWRECPSVAALASHPRILEVLQFLYDRVPIPFQTLNFLHGTQQPAHSDLTHFSSKPVRFMAGVWVALETMTPENGPLFYYPGSHRLPVLDFSDFDSSIDDEALGARYRAFQALLDDRFERIEFHAQRGQALIWAGNLWHGGSPVQDAGSTRHSQVTHYYFEDCFYFFPMESTPTLGQYCLKDIVNIQTGEKVRHTFNGHPVKASEIGKNRARLEVEE